MTNYQMKFEPFSENEIKKISKKWRVARRIILYFLAIGVVTPFILIGVLTLQNQKLNLEFLLTSIGFGVFFFVLGLILFFTNQIYKDLKHKEKFLLRTVIKKIEYKRRIGFTFMQMKNSAPYSIDFEVTKMKFYDALMTKQSALETKESKFIFTLSNGLKYEVIENGFVSENIGALLELHIAKHSGFVLSFRRIKPEEISKEEYSEIKQKFLSNSKKAKKEDDDFFNIDLNKADEIK